MKAIKYVTKGLKWKYQQVLFFLEHRVRIYFPFSFNLFLLLHSPYHGTNILVVLIKFHFCTSLTQDTYCIVTKEFVFSLFFSFWKQNFTCSYIRVQHKKLIFKPTQDYKNQNVLAFVGI